MTWQNELLTKQDESGKSDSQTYLKTVHNQLSAFFNYVMKFYGLRENPVRQAGNMGKEERKEMLFWCGIREDKLLALTPEDFNFSAGTVTINKFYQRIKGRNVIIDSKTPKSNRTIQMPAF